MASSDCRIRALNIFGLASCFVLWIGGNVFILAGPKVETPQCSRGHLPPSYVKEHAADVTADLQRVLNERGVNCNILLRNIQRFLDKRLAPSKGWLEIEKTLDSQGFRLSQRRKTASGWVYSYLAKKDIVVASKIHWDLFFEIDVKEIKKGSGNRGAGVSEDKVIGVTGRLRATLNMPYLDAVRERGHPLGSVLQFILNSPEVRSQGQVWPILKSVSVRYAPAIAYVSSETSHAAFLADVEFAAKRDEEIGGLTLRLDIQSELEPERYWDGTPTKLDFQPRDTLSNVFGYISTEWWKGDDATVKTNKAKYLKTPSNP